MARPSKVRTLEFIPQSLFYLPLEAEDTEKKPHEIAIEDFEVVRLVDGHALTITEAAKRIGVSKSTAGRMLTRCRRAIALGFESRSPLYFDASENLRLRIETCQFRTASPSPNQYTAIAINDLSVTTTVSSLFGRASHFILLDSDFKETTRIQNPGLRSARDSGTAAVQKLSQHPVSTVIAGRFGPHAAKALAKAKIKSLPMPNASLEEVIATLRFSKK